MANYREIVTKAVISKGKKVFTDTGSVIVNDLGSTILGCWVINHKFSGTKNLDSISISGSYDINIWYSFDNDTKTDVVRETRTYNEVVRMRNNRDDVVNEEIVIRSLKQPNCIKIDIKDGVINYVIEKELGIELVGDIKVKIEINEMDDLWDEILEEDVTSNIDKVIDKEVKEDFIDEIK